MNEDEVKNLSSSMAALTKQIEKNNAAMLISGKSINNQKKDLEDILENSQNIERSEKNQGKYLNEIKNSMKEALTSSLKISSTLTTIGTAAFAANIIKDIIDLDNKMTALSVRMGKGHEGIKELKGSVHGLQKEFGTSYENAVMLVEELAKDKYVGNIKNAAAGIDLFSRASGVAAPEILELTNNLSKMGGLGTDSINSMYAGMIKIQQQVGISDKGMHALVRTVNEMSFNMAAFGKSSEDIKKMANETTALVGAMEKVGISASRSTELVQQLTDPDRIEDNIMLYSQLGISMEDAMSGSIDGSNLDGQFKNMADKIVQMGPIAGSSFAKSMGLSYKEVTRMAKMEAGAAKEIAEKALTPEEQALETMKSLEKATEGIGKQFEVGLNKVEGILKSLPSALLIGLAVITPLLIRQGKKIIHKIFDKKEMQASVADAVIPSIENSVKKAGGIVKGQTAKLGNVIKGNIGQWFDSTAVGGFFSGIDKRTDAAMSRFNKESFIDKFLGTSKKNALDDVNARLIELDASTEKIFSNFSSLGIKGLIDENTKSINTELLQEEIGKASDAKDSKRLSALISLQSSYNKILNEKNGLTVKKNNLDNGQLALMEKQAEQASMLSEKENNLAEIENLKNKKTQDQNNLLIEAARLRKEAEDLDEIGKAAALAQADALTSQASAMDEEIEKLQKRNEELETSLNLGEEEINQMKEKNNLNSKSSFGKLKDGIKTRVSTAFGHTTLGKALQERRGKLGREKLGGAEVFKTTAKTAGKGLVKGAGKLGLGALKGIGKGIGGILKTMGPMALVAGIAGRLLSKIQEPLEKAMNTIVDKMSPIVESMMPAIEILMNTIATKILPPILTVAGYILKGVHALLSPLIWILRALEHVPLIGGALKGLGDTLDAATGPAVTDGLLTAASSLSKSSIKMEASSENLDDAVTSEDGPMAISARGATMVATGTTSREEPAGSSSGKSSEERLKEAQEETNTKNNLRNMECINENTSVLPKILKGIENLLEILTNKDINIYDENSNNVLLET